MIGLRCATIALVLITAVLSGGCGDSPDVVRVAVSSNFLPTAEILRDQFEHKESNKIRFVSGSTGKLAAQIRNGASIDLFLSADSKTVDSLVNEGQGIKQRVYANGKLVLFHPGAKSPRTVEDFDLVAIANPDLAPYGVAAESFLKKFEGKVVRGQNVSHAYQMVRSGAAEAGFVSLSQVLSDEQQQQNKYTVVPESSYPPIAQKALLISKNPVAKEFYVFLSSKEAISVIRKNGYDVRDE